MQNNPAKNSKYYQRDLLKRIKPYYKVKEIIAILGSRQVGKTTLLNMIFKDLSRDKKCLFLTFESRSDLEIFQTDIESFKKLYCAKHEVIFIDEFQYAKDAGQKLKYLFDTTNVKFFISGSSSLEIKNAGKYLVGRVFTFYLNPFSFSEYLRVKDPAIFKLSEESFTACSRIFLGLGGLPENIIKSQSILERLRVLFEDYLIFGGYPRIVTAKDQEEKKLVLESILDNYLLREIRSLLHLATENALLSLARFLSLQIGNLISYNELSNVTQTPITSIRKHLKILEQTLITGLIFPYFTNKRVELVKTPKVYFLDNGFRNKMIDNFTESTKRSDIGALAENFVFNVLRNYEGKLNFWRTKSQAEVDFCLEKGGQIIPVEVKYSPLGKKILGKSLVSFIKKYKPQITIITTNGEFGVREIEKTKVIFMPIFFLS